MFPPLVGGAAGHETTDHITLANHKILYTKSNVYKKTRNQNVQHQDTMAIKILHNNTSYNLCRSN